jgi:hypothetical protein
MTLSWWNNPSERAAFAGGGVRDTENGKPLFVIYIDDRGRHAGAESWLP